MAGRSGITVKGVKEAQAATKEVMAYLQGKSAGARRHIVETIGLDIVDQIDVNIRKWHRRKGTSGQLRRSIGWSRSGRLGLDIFSDLSVAPYGRIRELGGVIKATMSKFKNAAGQPLLVFKPYGADHFVSVRQVKQKGTHYMERAIKTRLSNFGSPKLLDEKLGFEISKIFAGKSWKGRL